MKKYLVTVGIDVSKSKSDARFVFDLLNTAHAQLVVAHNEKGIKGHAGLWAGAPLSFCIFM